MLSELRRWGLLSTVRYLGRRAYRRFWSSLEDRDIWRDAYWRRGYFQRKGARLGWPSAIAMEVKVVGPYENLETGNHVGLGENSIYLTIDGRLLPYFGLWWRATIRIRDHVLIGTAAVVYPGVTIGPKAIAGAFTVVNRDVGEDAVVMGQPFRTVGALKRFYLRRVEDIQRHPEKYPETFDGRARIPWDDLPPNEDDFWRTDFGGDLMTRLRNLLRSAILWVWDNLQEPDDFRASEQRIHLMRKFGYRIGEHCYIDPRAFFDLRASQITIGDHCYIGPYASITVHEGFCQNYTGRIRVEPVVIREGCAIGAAAVINPGVTIGPYSVVEPATVVLRDVPPYTVVAGSPARPVGTIWDWLEERRREIEAHPEQYVAEPRIVTAPLPPREAVPSGALDRAAVEVRRGR